MPHVDYIDESGVRYPSVTEVLGHKSNPWLEMWKRKYADRVTPGRRNRAEWKLEASNKVGTEFHRCAELWLKAEDAIPASRRTLAMCRLLDKWKAPSSLSVKHTEYHVVSKAYQYQGTFDAVIEMNDHIWILDWKTNNGGIKPEAKYQLAAYAQAYFEATRTKIGNGIVVHVSKQHGRHRLTVKEYKLTKTVLNVFLRRLEAYRKDHDGVAA